MPPYIDTQVLPGHTYDYRVAAFNLSATSAYSNTASVMIPGIPPIAPDQLDAVFEPGPPPMIALAWQDNSLDETGFVIERSTDGGPFSVLANAVANVTTYDDLSVLGGYTYTYRVAAFNANGTSTWSVPTASASVPPDATPPAAPSNLSATNVLQTSLTLTWTDNSNNEAGFTIQRATDSAFTKNLVTINVPGANLTNLAFFNDSGLVKKTKYFYRVLA